MVNLLFLTKSGQTRTGMSEFRSFFFNYDTTGDGEIYYFQEKCKEKKHSRESKNAAIYKSVSVSVDFVCFYDNVYRDITATNVTISGENINSSSFNEGKLQFTLTQYTNSSFIEKVDADFRVKLGNEVYFLLAMENPIQSLSYSITGD